MVHLETELLIHLVNSPANQPLRALSGGDETHETFEIRRAA